MKIFTPNQTASLEAQLLILNELCAITTGRYYFPEYNEKRMEVLKQLETCRPLSRWEYICCYGYAAWKAYTTLHNVPETHEFANCG